MSTKNLVFITLLFLGTFSLDGMQEGSALVSAITEECPICFQGFTPENPKLTLPHCVHALCESCKNNNEALLVCPLCRAPVVSRESFVEALGGENFRRALSFQGDPNLNTRDNEGMNLTLNLPLGDAFFNAIKNGENENLSRFLQTQLPEDVLKAGIGVAMRLRNLSAINMILDEFFTRRDIQLDKGFWNRHYNNLKHLGMNDIAQQWSLNAAQYAQSRR